MLDQLFSALGERAAQPEFWLNSALLLALARALWVIVGKATEALVFRMALRTTTLTVRLLARASPPPAIKAVRLLFIRHGNDTYIQHLASDQERNHGRLKNSIQPVRVTQSGEGVALGFSVKVHNRLGTQFKMFIEVEPEGQWTPRDIRDNPSVKAVLDYLALHDNVDDIGISARPGRVRIFFLLRDFDEVTTVEGFRNNMIWPV